MKIVTGRTGELHVTSDDDRHLHAGTFGDGTYILNTGSKLNASNPSSNVIRLAKGDIMFHGCHIRIEDYEDVELSPGTEGYSRVDIICCQYKKKGGVESAELVVYQGTPAMSNPTDPIPAYIDNNILDGAEIADMPLCKITITGVNITGIERIATIEKGMNEIFNLIYPVGCIYMSASDTNPSNLFGGTWVAWGSGRVPVGVNGNDANFNGAEKTGGVQSITLASNNIPPHSHSINDNGHDHSVSIESRNVITVAGQVGSILTDTANPGNRVPSSLGTIAGEKISINTTTTGITLDNAYGNVAGGVDPITNLQPYITCYMWKRTA